MSKNILRILLFVLLANPAFCVEFVRQEYGQRSTKFSQDRNHAGILDHTQNIHRTLTSKINPKRKATLAEKEVAFKAIIASVMIHEDTVESYSQYNRALNVSAEIYTKQIDAIKDVYSAARSLKKSFLDKKGVSEKSLPSDLKTKNLLTENFVSWFCEVLSEHYDEWSYFTGPASLSWFKESCDYYNQGQHEPFSDNRFPQVKNKEGEPIAIYKQAQNPFYTYINRRAGDELMASLVAKNAGLGCVNPVIPVRIKGKRMMLDFFKPTGTLEPYVSRPKGPSCKNQDLQDFVDVISQLSTNFDLKRIGESLDDLQMDPQGDGKIIQDKRTQVLRYIKLLQRQDIISNQNLLEILWFFYITGQVDMYSSNLPLQLSEDGNSLKVTVIDYDRCFGYETNAEAKFKLPAIRFLDQMYQKINLTHIPVAKKFDASNLRKTLDHLHPTRSQKIHTDVEAKVRPLKTKMESSPTLIKLLQELTTKMVDRKDVGFYIGPRIKSPDTDSPDGRVQTYLTFDGTKYNFFPYIFSVTNEEQLRKQFESKEKYTGYIKLRGYPGY